MAQISDSVLMEKIDQFISENKKDHDKIMKLLLGNGEIGLIEQGRNQAKDILSIKKEINHIKKTYTRRKMSLKMKLAIFTAIATNIGLLLTIMNWLNRALEPLRVVLNH